MAEDGTADDPGPLAVAWRRSWLGTHTRGLNAGVASGASSARTVAALDHVRRVAGHSRLYRWLTTPPSEERIVLDLADSRLVGPLVPAVLWARTAAENAWDHAATRRGACAFVRHLHRAPVRAASAVLLVLVVTSLVAAARRSTPIDAGSLAILAGLALLGLREGRSWAELADTRVGSALASLVEPPAEEPQR